MYTKKTENTKCPKCDKCISEFAERCGCGWISGASKAEMWLMNLPEKTRMELVAFAGFVHGGISVVLVIWLITALSR